MMSMHGVNLPAVIAEDDNLSIGRTNVITSTTNVTHVWIIDNFKTCFQTYKGDEFIESVEFDSHLPNVGRFSWRIKLHSRKIINSIEHLCLLLSCHGFPACFLQAKVKYSIVDLSGNTMEARDEQFSLKFNEGETAPATSPLTTMVAAPPPTANYNNGFNGGYYSSVADPAAAEYMNKYILSDGTLRLMCHIAFNGVVAEMATRLGKPPKPATSTESATEMFRSLLKSEKFSDFDIQVGDTIFKTHKAILASRSPFFDKLLGSGMKETQQNRLVFDNDFSSEAVRAMLEFIYADVTDVKDETAVELLRLSDMYNLDGLKNAAEVHLCGGVDEMNVYDMLLLAERVRAEELKDVCVELILKHIRNFRQTPQWAAFKRDHAELACGVLEKLKG